MPVVFPELTPEQQAEAVVRTESQAHSNPRKAGDCAYVISASWFTAWCQHTGHTYHPVQQKLVPAVAPAGPSPGPIDNSSIVDSGAPPGDLDEEELAAVAPLLPGLREKQHFWALHESTWQLLKDWYKVAGPEVCRHYIPTGAAKRLEIDFNEWAIKAVDEHSGRAVVVAALAQCTAGNLKHAACAVLQLEAEEHVLMSYEGMKGDPETLEVNLHKTLTGLRLKNRQAVLLRRKDHPQQQAAAQHRQSQALKIVTPATGISVIPGLPLGPKSYDLAPMSIGGGGSSSGLALALGSPLHLTPASPKRRLATSPSLMSGSPLSRSFGHAPGWAEDTIVQSAGARPGLAGLGNLGNTCFMNSSLQCLSHTVPLMRTFLTGAYRQDINRDNPLGLGGKLAAAYGALQSKLWRGGVAHVSPKHFKWQLGKFAPQFHGYQQQDSQELLAFLLDGLHEDLNRIVEKPYVEEKDSDGRPDWEVAAEAWANYRARNDSPVVDHFQGLLKSTLRCPQCQHQSVKMDPFMYLTLPLPTPNTRTFSLLILHAHGTAPPLQLAVEVPKAARIAQLLAAAAACVGDAGEEGELAERWALAYWHPSARQQLDLYTDSKARVTSIQQPRSSGFSFTSSTTQRSQLIAYRYPNAAAGPGGGGRAVAVLHTAKEGYSTVHVAPPSLLYLPSELFSSTAAGGSGSAAPPADVAQAEQVAASGGDAAVPSAAGPAPALLQLEQLGKTGYWAVAPGSEIEAAMDRFLAPFKRRPTPLALASAEVSAAAPPSQGSDRQVPGNAGGGAPLAQGSSPAAGVPPVQGAMGHGEAEGGGMEVDAGDGLDAEGLEEPATPVLSVDDVLSSDDDMPAALTDLTTLPPPEEVGAAFDMFATQGDADMAVGDGAQASAPPDGLARPGAGAGGAAEVAAVELRFQLVVAEGPSGKRKYAWNLDRLLGGVGAEDAVFLCAEWGEAAAAALDHTPWEQPVQHPSVAAATAAAAKAHSGVSLSDCLEAFLQPEQLDADDSWYCSACKAHVQADKKLDLWRLPEVLVVHLKRFSYSRYSRDKLDTEVDFPLEKLDLRQYVPPAEASGEAAGAAADASRAAALPRQEPPVYDLFAVSNHFGGLGGGHYTATCRMPDDSRWYTFDDATVREAGPGEVQSSAAYVLFYRRSGARSDDVLQVIEGAASAGLDDRLAAMDAESGAFSSGRGAVPGLALVGEVEHEGQDEEGGVALVAADALSAPPMADVCAAPAGDDLDDEVINMEGVA